MQTSSASYAAIGAERLALSLWPGRRRRLEHLVFSAVGLIAGYHWLGCSGVGLLLLWAHALWPRGALHQSIPLHRLRLGAVHGARMVLYWPPNRQVEVFADELPARDWLALRRLLVALPSRRAAALSRS